MLASEYNTLPPVAKFAEVLHINHGELYLLIVALRCTKRATNTLVFTYCVTVLSMWFKLLILFPNEVLAELRGRDNITLKPTYV